jgi:hypothetical protein
MALNAGSFAGSGKGGVVHFGHFEVTNGRAEAAGLGQRGCRAGEAVSLPVQARWFCSGPRPREANIGQISMTTRDELVVALAGRDASSRRKGRGRILDEFVAVSGLK